MTLRLSTFLILLLTLPIAACDSGEAEASPAAAEFGEANSKAFQAIATGIGGGGLFLDDREDQARRSDLVECAEGGSVDVDVTGGGYRLQFADCYDVTGLLNVAQGDFSFSETGIRSSFTYNGDLSVAQSCDLSYDGLSAVTEISLQTLNQTIVYDGTVRAACPSGNTTCRFDGVQLDIDLASGEPPELPNPASICD